MRRIENSTKDELDVDLLVEKLQQIAAGQQRQYQTTHSGNDDVLYPIQGQVDNLEVFRYFVLGIALIYILYFRNAIYG